MADVSVSLFGPLDALLATGSRAEFVVLVLVVSNILTRKLANDRYRRQAEDGADALSRHPLHIASTWGLVLASFYFLTLNHHSGVVLTVLVLGMFVADFFEFESRKVEVREDLPLERPSGAIVASLIVLLYAAYLSLFFVIAPIWFQIV